ncbi:hypothetical protein QUF63_06580 [Anaerolineales bacterium HSG25]|nr:hypothetical protein [Anaerolineales bacterium HSG25]
MSANFQDRLNEDIELGEQRIRFSLRVGGMSARLELKMSLFFDVSAELFMRDELDE